MSIHLGIKCFTIFGNGIDSLRAESRPDYFLRKILLTKVNV